MTENLVWVVQVGKTGQFLPAAGIAAGTKEDADAEQQHRGRGGGG